MLSNMMSRTDRVHAAAHGIGVTVACPSGFEAPIHEKLRAPAAYQQAVRSKAGELDARAAVDAGQIAELIHRAVLANRSGCSRIAFRGARMAHQTLVAGTLGPSQCAWWHVGWSDCWTLPQG